MNFGENPEKLADKANEGVNGKTGKGGETKEPNQEMEGAGITKEKEKI